MRAKAVHAEVAGGALPVVSSAANRHDGPTLAGLDSLCPLPDGIAAHLDRGYDSAAIRDLLAGLAIIGVIARKGESSPLQVGKRWVVERTHAWMNGYGKLRRCTEHAGTVVDFYLFLAATFVVTRCLIRQARTRYRWDNRPTTRRLK